jgi:hypothetical protein
MADFGVERHTLVTREITHVFHQTSTVVLQDLVATTHLFREREKILRRFSGLPCPIDGDLIDSPPTHLRGRPYTLFS